MSSDLSGLGLVPSETRPPLPGGGPQHTAEVIDRAVAAAPERECLVGRHGRYSFAELDAAANRAANALAALGVVPGARVAACLPNDADLPVLFLATQRLGALWVGVSRLLAPPEKAYLLRDAGAHAYVTLRESAGEIEARRGELPELAHVVGIAPGEPDCDWRRRCEAASASRPAAPLDPFAPAAIAYTSGTTGHPKGAVHSAHNLLLPGTISHLTRRVPEGTRQGAVLPLTILNLVVLEVLAPWLDGRTVVAIDRIDPLGLAEWIRNERVGAFSGVPTIFHDLLTHPEVKPADLASLVAPGVGGSDVPPEVVRLYRERFQRPVGIGYGMTEAPTAVTWSDGSVPSGPGLCGKPLPQVEIEIVDEEGRLLPPGEIGEITVRPARSGPYAGVYTPMLGYWRKPEATAAALRDGHYHTGDLGLLAEDGNLYIRGRRNELILRGGANVYPAEVERALQEHEGVAYAAVFGLPDERLGERVVAVVEPPAGVAAPSEEELRQFCTERIARYKVPHRIASVPQMPRNAMNKIVKRELAGLFRSG
ncbi:MAG: class I adenylate-forming enzyme family protein [Myxococcota bacterium]